MALDLALDPHGTGLYARYWRITSAHLDHMSQTATVWLHGWADQAARLAGRTPAGSLTVALATSALPGGNLHGASTAALYTAIKQRAAAEADAAADAAAADVQRATAFITHGVQHLAGAADI